MIADFSIVMAGNEFTWEAGGLFKKLACYLCDEKVQTHISYLNLIAKSKRIILESLHHSTPIGDIGVAMSPT